EKSVTLAILTAKQDKQYLPQALAALKSQDGELLKAGLLAVETFGGEKEVPALLEQAFSGNDKGLATQILSRKGGKEIDAALVAALKAEKDNGRYEALADILSRRWNTSIRPILLEKAKQADYPNRLRLLQIAEGISGKDNVGEFVDVWEAIADRGQKDNAEQIISRLCGGDSAPVTAKRTAANESAMWSLLARVGDDKSLADIRKAVFEEKPGTDKFAAVFNALRNYPDGRVADDLFKVAQSGDFPENDRVNALRSFIRVISLPNDRIRIPINDKQQVEKLAKAFDLAARVDEKRYVIERVGQIRTVESLTFVLKHFDDAELQDRVIRSVLDLAHHTDLRRRDKEAFTAALDKVLATTKHQDLLERAKRYKDNF
ncbi:MAG: hypothetical protein LBN39_01545, partial [Planctomycetaceae bacterium]|nr:hypothetical protein [Planctomycetaceae bacterium]